MGIAQVLCDEIQNFIEMGTALVISFLYQRMIYLHLHNHCVMGIALCISLIVFRGQYAKEEEIFHHCTTAQARANIYSRCSMGAKDKERVWEDDNCHGSISSF